MSVPVNKTQPGAAAASTAAVNPKASASSEVVDSPTARTAVNPTKTTATKNGATVLRPDLSITQPNHDHIAKANKLAARL